MDSNYNGLLHILEEENGVVIIVTQLADSLLNDSAKML